MGAKELVTFCCLFLALGCFSIALAGEKGKDATDLLVKEQEKHLKRLATFDRLEELMKEHKNEAMLEKIKMLREKEQSRHQRVVDRLKRGSGKGKPDKSKPDDKGKPDWKGKRDDKGKPDNKGKWDDRGKGDDNGRPDEKGKGKGKGKGR
jgi:hypothetical protein